jgi:hypothetical protein
MKDVGLMWYDFSESPVFASFSGVLLVQQFGGHSSSVPFNQPVLATKDENVQIAPCHSDLSTVAWSTRFKKCFLVGMPKDVGHLPIWRFPRIRTPMDTPNHPNLTKFQFFTHGDLGIYHFRKPPFNG